MNKIAGILIVMTMSFSVNIFAESSKLTKVDLDVKSTQIVRADLGIDDFYYYIDTDACVCWLSRLIGGSPTITAIDCSRLIVHPNLEQYLGKCVSKPIAIKKEEPAVVDKNAEITDKDKDKEKDKDKDKNKDKNKKDKDKKDKDKKDKEKDKDKDKEKGKDKPDLTDIKKESNKILEDVVEKKQ